MPPAAARVVPRAEMTVWGGGVREASLLAHWVVSASTVAWRLPPLDFGARREMVWMVWDELVGERRVDRICEPTRPVHPKIAVVDMVYLGVIVMLLWLFAGSANELTTLSPWELVTTVTLVRASNGWRGVKIA